MANHTVYPNLSWAQFEMFNDNKTDAFEEMCKDLFICEYLKDSKIPHADHNNPGVEVVPILEPLRCDGLPQRRISYQAKYFTERIKDSDVIDSLKKTVEYYGTKLDVIYLFCNKVISIDTKRYQKYTDVLSPANIKLELVTDKDIFVLIRKYPRVANYFFQDRARALASANVLMETVTISSSVSDVRPVCNNTSNNILLQELLKEKMEKCQNVIFDLRFGELKSELGSLSTVSVESTDGRVDFFRIILAAHEKEDFSTYIDKLPDSLKEEAYWLKNFTKNIRTLSVDEFMNISDETKIVVLALLFSSQYWDCIIDLHRDRERLPQKILKAFDFHYALSLFNKGECYKAYIILDGLYNRYHEQRFKLYSICSLLHKANKEFIFGSDSHVATTKDLLTKLDAVKELVTDQIKANEPLIAVLELQACFNLGATEKTYLYKAFEKYNDYSDNAKTTDGVRLFAGLCYEMSGDIKKAAELFSECAWRTDENFASRYLTSLIDLNRLEDAKKAFNELEKKASTPRVKAVYLLVLYRLNSEEYREILEIITKECDKSLSDLYIIGFYVEDSQSFDEVIQPKLEILIPKELPRTDIHDKVGLLAVLAHNEKLDLLSAVLESIQDYHAINSFVVHDVYKCLFNIANQEYSAWRFGKEVKNELIVVQKIADKFIEADVQKKEFLQIGLLCVSANHMVFSMLKYSRELFEYTHDPQTARNIIALLYERNETKLEEYEPYMNALEGIDDPALCMTMASVKFKLGFFDEADFYAYKAIYLLNGTDDFEVYKSLFAYSNLSLVQRQEKTTKKTIFPNMIVILETEGKTWKVALDSEDCFGESNNKSLGVEHIGRTDPVYTKLIGKGKKQRLNLRGKAYNIVSFEPREVALGRLVYQKVQEHPDEFNGTVWMISTDNPEEMVKQILSLSDNREQTKALIEAYDFENNQLGIPIDFFIHGDYERYIGIQQYLLYKKDLAYYAGEPRSEFVVEASYIPALSTLTLLASKGWLDTLDWLDDRIVIPESYLQFFKEQYATEVGKLSKSVGSLVPLDDGKFTIVEADKRLPDIWESIINKCGRYPVETVTDDERISYEIVNGYTWERLFAKTKIDKVQMDAMIVAERKKGVYICDDLFFRKIAAYKQIKHINYATLLYSIEDLDVVMPILVDLSKTNYIYTPFRFRTNEEAKQLVVNLLDGKKKNIYYSQFLNAYFRVCRQILEQNFESAD